jgi:hypothetical protein
MSDDDAEYGLKHNKTEHRTSAHLTMAAAAAATTRTDIINPHTFQGGRTSGIGEHNAKPKRHDVYPSLGCLPLFQKHVWLQFR